MSTTSSADYAWATRVARLVTAARTDFALDLARIDWRQAMRDHEEAIQARDRAQREFKRAGDVWTGSADHHPDLYAAFDRARALYRAADIALFESGVAMDRARDAYAAAGGDISSGVPFGPDGMPIGVDIRAQLGGVIRD